MKVWIAELDSDFGYGERDHEHIGVFDSQESAIAYVESVWFPEHSLAARYALGRFVVPKWNAEAIVSEIDGDRSVSIWPDEVITYSLLAGQRS